MTGVALNVSRTGVPGGPVLLLGPSLGTDMEMWRPQLGALEDAFDVVRFDIRGHGRSPVPPGPYTIDDLGGDVLDLLDRLDVDRFRYAGLSLGGMVGMWVASHVPDRVQRLALLCTAAYLPPAQGWLDRAALARAEGTAPMTDASLARWFTPGFLAAQPGRVAPFRQMLASTPAEGYAACCEAIAGMDLRPGLGRITAPTLVVAGADDPSTPPVFGQEIADLISDARLEILAPAAHMANAERADEVGRLLHEHLTG
jgi:3-oxoadipate enol-lactonase